MPSSWVFTCISFVSWLVGCTPVHAATSKESLWCVAQQVWDKDTTTSDDLIGSILEDDATHRKEITFFLVE